MNQTVGPGTRLPCPAVDSSSLECPLVSARSSCHRGDLDVQLPLVPSTRTLSVAFAVISGLCFNRSASSHAERVWLCGSFRQLPAPALPTPFFGSSLSPQRLSTAWDTIVHNLRG